MKKTILVTGGAGFIGSCFTRHIFGSYPDYRILVLDALTYAGNVRNLPADCMESERFEFWYGNVANAELVDALVSRSDVVLHFAAESHVTRSIYNNRLFFETDVLGTQTVANAVVKHQKKVKTFVHISTSEVYGTALSDKISEDHPLNPQSPYASAKCGADRLVYSYWHTYGIPAVIVRPFNNYGPYQHLEKLIPRFITSCLMREALTVHGDGSAARDWLYVEDTCAALDRIIHAPREVVEGQVFNLGTGRHLSIVEIADILKVVTGNDDVRYEYIPNRPGQVFRHTCDNSKIKQALGWEPKVGFEEGIERTYDWYSKNEGWWRPLTWMRRIPIVTTEGRREVH